MPEYEEFKNYAVENAKRLNYNIDLQALQLKYESWRANGWRGGAKYDEPIVNWKSKILGSLKYLLLEHKKPLNRILHDSDF
jgi:hypothetical protein